MLYKNLVFHWLCIELLILGKVDDLCINLAIYFDFAAFYLGELTLQKPKSCFGWNGVRVVVVLDFGRIGWNDCWVGFIQFDFVARMRRCNNVRAQCSSSR